MLGSSGVAALIAHTIFWALIFYGWALGGLNLRRIAFFLLLWLAARVGLPYVPYGPAHAMFPSLVAVLDIALVFTIFKGDIRVT